LRLPTRPGADEGCATRPPRYVELDGRCPFDPRQDAFAPEFGRFVKLRFSDATIALRILLDMGKDTTGMNDT